MMKESILTLLSISALSFNAYSTENTPKELKVIISEYETETTHLNMPGVQYMILR